MSSPLALTELYARRLVAVIRAPSTAAAVAAAHAVADGGVTLLEVTFTVPEAPRAIAELSKRAGVIVGAGTVLTADQARAALDAGARFVIAPNCAPVVARIAVDAGVAYIPGAYTTGEIIAARDAGAHVVKVYPVGVAGGPDYIRVIRDPLPDIPMLAAGGTNLTNAAAFLEAGCVGIGLGAALADPALAAQGELAEITRRARAFVERVAPHASVGVARSSA